MRNPTPQQIADARLAVEALESCNGNQVHAAAKLKIARGTLQNRLKIAERLDSYDEKSELVEAKKQIGLREAEIRDLAGRLKRAEEAQASDDEIERRIFQLAREKLAPPKWLFEVKAATGIAGVPCSIWSDWHLGEVVSLTETNGINQFGLEIAERRIKRLVERTIDLSFSHMTGAKYPGIVVNIIGDIVSGEIHQELADTNEDDLYPIIIWAVERIVSALKALAEKFGRVYVVWSFGNHGRMDKKPRAKRRAFRNADWLIGRFVWSHLKGDDRFAWNIPESGDAYYRVYNHTYFATHGDALGVKGGDGIIGALGPIKRGEIKVANSESQIGRPFQTMLIGHWHQYLPLPGVIVNNTLKGYDEYTRYGLRAPPSIPSQSLWFTHPKWGITARWEVMLENPPKEQEKSAAWVSAFKEAA